MSATIGRPRLPPDVRFWPKVDHCGQLDCWPWKGSRSPDGYGKFSVGYKDVRAHRMAYELAFGPIPDGALVRHKCDNPPCCNPAHLELGTSKDNCNDAVVRGRTLKGERNPNAKLSDSDVENIICRLGTGETQVSVARRYGITQANVSLIKTREGRGHA